MTIPDSVIDLGVGVFFGCEQLRSVHLPESIELIPENTFRNTPNLQTVTIAANKVLIDLSAFDAESNVTLIGVPGSYTETYSKRMGLSFESIRQD